MKPVRCQNPKCKKPLVGRRPNTKHCNTNCRVQAWNAKHPRQKAAVE